MVLCCYAHAQVDSMEVMRLMRRLATGRLVLDRCVAHPDYNREAMNASNLFLETQRVSSKLDRLVNDIHFNAASRMPYMGYSNVLRQLKILENSKVKEDAKKVGESISSACDTKRIDMVKTEFLAVEKQIKPLLLSQH